MKFKYFTIALILFTPFACRSERPSYTRAVEILPADDSAIRHGAEYGSDKFDDEDATPVVDKKGASKAATDDPKSTDSGTSGTTKPLEPTHEPVTKPDPVPPKVEPVAPIPPKVDPVPPVVTEKEKLKASYLAMLNAKMVVTQVDVTNPVGWGTSQTNRINVLVAVDANGKPFIPANVTMNQTGADMDQAKDQSFLTTAKTPLTDLHSFMRVCNKSQKPIFLHAQQGAPFVHGDAPIDPGKCSKFLVRNTDTIQDGASYDHLAGGTDKANYLYFMVTKIKPDGSTL